MTGTMHPAIARAEGVPRADILDGDHALGELAATEHDLLIAIRPAIETLSGPGLAALMALANGRLLDSDPRKIRMTEVRSLRRLARQAHALDATMIVHAEERRMLGEGDGGVSQEAANTAIWTERLIHALEGIVRRSD